MAAIEVSNQELTYLQMACMDRITNLREIIKSAELRKEEVRAGRLRHQLERVENLLARLVQL